MVAAFNADGTPAPTTQADHSAVLKAGRDKTARQRAAYDAGLNKRDPPEGPLSADDQTAYEAGLEDADKKQAPKKAATKAPKKTAGPVAAGHPEAPAASAFGPLKGQPKDETHVTTASVPQSVTNLSQEGAGVLLGLIAYAVVINYLRGQGTGVKAWFNAKFFNNPNGSASTPQAAANGSAVATAPQAGAAPTASTSEPV